MIDVLILKGFGDVEDERLENRLMMFRYKEVMSWFCIIDDFSLGRVVGKFRFDVLVFGKWLIVVFKCVCVIWWLYWLRFMIFR